MEDLKKTPKQFSPKEKARIEYIEKQKQIKADTNTLIKKS